MIKGKNDINGFKKPVKGVRKMCFECFKWLPLRRYSMIDFEGIKVRSDYCKTCETKPKYKKPIKATLQDSPRMNFVVGVFIG